MRVKSLLLAILACALAAGAVFAADLPDVSSLKDAAKEAVTEAVKEGVKEAVAEVKKGAAKFHIGIVTGTVSQSEDDLRGAELMIAKYGDTSKGGMITHITYPDQFMSSAKPAI